MPRVRIALDRVAMCAMPGRHISSEDMHLRQVPCGGTRDLPRAGGPSCLEVGAGAGEVTCAGPCNPAIPEHRGTDGIGRRQSLQRLVGQGVPAVDVPGGEGDRRLDCRRVAHEHTAQAHL